MSAPLLIGLATIIIAFLSFLTRNQRTTSALLAASGAAMISLFVLFAPFDSAFGIAGIPVRFDSRWVVLGRALSLEAAVRPMIGFLYIVGLLLMSGSWVVSVNRFFPAIAMLFLFTVAGSIMVEPFLYAAAFIGLAAMGSVLMLVSPDHPSSTGAVRLMVLYTFAVIAILISGWMIDTGSGTATALGEGVRAAGVISLGFAILLALPPFHVWITRSMQETDPYVLAFVIVVLQAAGFFLLLRFLDSYAWLRTDPILISGMRFLSIGAMVLTSLWALTTSDLRQVFGYAIIADICVVLLAVSNAEVDGIRISLGLFGSRILSIGIVALGLSRLSIGEGEWEGVGRIYPFAALGILIGLLSLSGFPLTAGFPGRWALLSLELSMERYSVLVVLITMMVFTFIVLRWAAILFAPGSVAESERIYVTKQLYFVFGLAGLIILGIAPQIVIPWVVEVATGLTNLFP
jgi:NADH-quinone oxidoreductase subunit N